ncbi:uncharacterized protein ACHE_10293S [Aspergillus chevalieri]|uniref:Uncharacterized protein n=1 Tax=Aspergillus chevalieri TaxID=182096 RepID=A0A7R7VDP4_ASPCH|nr:uncharacterized protein ACHE_10293S [Aspergillus chevalieri]BCR82891.1 hypothetical protein ACHE_10293S [Aspergillus chevalieri]
MASLTPFPAASGSQTRIQRQQQQQQQQQQQLPSGGLCALSSNTRARANDNAFARVWSSNYNP